MVNETNSHLISLLLTQVTAFFWHPATCCTVRNGERKKEGEAQTRETERQTARETEIEGAEMDKGCTTHVSVYN